MDNRRYLTREEELPQAKTFAGGLEFIRTNACEDGWFLQIETFDPHEPFYTPEKYKQLYPHDYRGSLFDWPPYDRVREARDQVEHCRYEYAALVSMCDAYLGKVLDALDELDLWRDTMLIVNTDHGFLLGEHEWWGKCIMPFYEEIAHIPLFIWDPRASARGERRSALVQTVDLAPTILDFFGLETPPAMRGRSLRETALRDAPVREAALFGIHGGHVKLHGWTIRIHARAAPRQYALLRLHAHAHAHALYVLSGGTAGRGTSRAFRLHQGLPPAASPGRGMAKLVAFLDASFRSRGGPGTSVSIA